MNLFDTLVHLNNVHGRGEVFRVETHKTWGRATARLQYGEARRKFTLLPGNRVRFCQRVRKYEP
jgi:hypothetical protein